MTDRKEYITGVFFMLLSAAGLAVTGLLGKIGFRSFTLTGMIFWRYCAAFFFCLALLWGARKLKEGIAVGNIWMHLLRACFVLGSQYSFYFFLERNSLLNAVALLNTGPLFIPLIEWSILKQQIPKAAWIAIAISFFGVILVLQPDAGIFSLMSFMGLFAGFCQGASQVVFGINSKRERSDLGVLLLLFFAMLISFVPFLSNDHRTFWEGIEWSDGMILLVSGLGIASVVNQLFRAEAYKRGSPSKLAAFLYLSVILAGIFDWIFFQIVPNALSLVGAALIVLGGVFKVYFHLRSLRM